MDESIRQLRTEARRLVRGKAPRGIRYPVAFRERAVALARTRLGRGTTLARVAREAGLPTQSLARWLRPRSTPALRPVALVPDPSAALPARSGLVLVTPQGVRVEGLDRESLIAVLRALV